MTRHPSSLSTKRCDTMIYDIIYYTILRCAVLQYTVQYYDMHIVLFLTLLTPLPVIACHLKHLLFYHSCFCIIQKPITYMNSRSPLSKISFSLTLYQCFSVVTEKYSAVRKFVKKSVKALSDIENEFSTEIGSNFWIIEKDLESTIKIEVRESVGNDNEKCGDIIDHNVKMIKINMDRDEDEQEKVNIKEKRKRKENVIVGCIGLKVRHTYVEPVQNSTNNSTHRIQLNSSKTDDIHQNKSIENRPDLALLSPFTSDPPVYDVAVGEVSHMCVESTHRKQGLAKILLTNLIEFASNSNYKNGIRVESVILSESTLYTKLKSLELSVVADLGPARTLYLDSGFEVMGPLVDVGGHCLLQHMSLKL